MKHTKQHISAFFSGRFFFLLVTYLMCISLASGQNTYRFSQYMFNELSVNPAYAGTKKAIVSNLVYRTQWMNIEGQPTTQILSIHSPIIGKKIGLGALLYNESLGIQNDFGCYLSYAYHISFYQSHLSLGLQAGITNKNVDWNKIITISEIQYNETDPAFPIENVSFIMPNMGFGAYYYSDLFYLGVSIPRIFTSELPIDNEPSELFSISSAQIHSYMSSGYVFMLKNGVAIKPSVLLKRVKNAPNQVDLNANVFFNSGINFGLGIHFKDSYVFMLGYNLSERLMFSYSFDLTTSNLAYSKPITHELVLNYMIHSRSDHILSPRYF